MRIPCSDNGRAAGKRSDSRALSAIYSGVYRALSAK